MAKRSTIDEDGPLTPEEVADIIAREEHKRTIDALKTARFIARHPEVRRAVQRRYREKHPKKKA